MRVSPSLPRHPTGPDANFNVWGGEAADWLDRTVRVPTLQSLTLEQWIERFQSLREKNRQLLAGKVGAQPGDRLNIGRIGCASRERCQGVLARDPAPAQSLQDSPG